MPDCADVSRSLQLDLLLQHESFDVIDFSYVIECLAAGARLPLKAAYYFSRCEATAAQSCGRVDLLGDR